MNKNFYFLGIIISLNIVTIVAMVEREVTAQYEELTKTYKDQGKISYRKYISGENEGLIEQYMIVNDAKYKTIGFPKGTTGGFEKLFNNFLEEFNKQNT